MSTKKKKKTAYYQDYDPSKLEMPEYYVKSDMCDDIACLENSLFAFGQKMVKLSKSLDGLKKQEIAAKIQDIVKKHCGRYLEPDDSIASLDEYDGLKERSDEDDEEYCDEDE